MSPRSTMATCLKKTIMDLAAEYPRITSVASCRLSNSLQHRSASDASDAGILSPRDR